MLVGSRDEVKLSIFVGQELQRHGHRVRVAIHSIFQSVVMKRGLEFFSISSDPEHPVARRDSGLMPGLASSRRVEVQKSSKILIDSLKACWIACTHPGVWKEKPFLAELIIATPLAHAHIHCAERLSIPLHIISTTPWTPTRDFPHPLAHISRSHEVDHEAQNYLSHLLIEKSVWHEIYHVVDYFRRAVLGLHRISIEGCEDMLRRFDVPHTYLFPSALIPKPGNWGNGISTFPSPQDSKYRLISMIDIAGYIAEEKQVPYTPPDDLARFLKSAVAPIFISIDICLLRNPERFVRCIKEASNEYGFAFLLPSTFHPVCGISESPDLFVLFNVPTEWLVTQVDVLFTHGNVPTLSMGLRHGKPIVSLPILQDRPFWSAAVFQAGVGPPPIHEKDFSCETLAQAIRYCYRAETQNAVSLVKDRINREDGLINAVASIHRHLRRTPCSIVKSTLANYRLKNKRYIQLSAVAAEVLIRSNALRQSELELIEQRLWCSQDHETDAVSEISASQVAVVKSVAVKTVGKALIKSIAKPTVSHIAEAYNGREVRVVYQRSLLPTIANKSTDNQGNSGAVAKTSEESQRSKRVMAIDAAQTVGFISAVFLGKVAMLPFKTVYYMGETASYSVKSLQGSNHREKKELEIGEQFEPVKFQRPVDAQSPMNRQLSRTIENLHGERGKRDVRIQDPGFAKMVLSEFENMCNTNAGSALGQAN
ncbi:uncharacterized protein N7498_003061 [Penicillium cinerascens]|uniref:Glycosyltransferase family 28 N-terminal domain-containing protein n=1 Tax=Penicillium cinerascens TaxID=70096 RepID=A0A9W9NCY4_9EURO|nr:uncharacterized protein N7498_003061 [Penicillium cinerascens]KAJ5216654.1 hypothetical protein N7498_003061 [Penicillium cinerascens]